MHKMSHQKRARGDVVSDVRWIHQDRMLQVHKKTRTGGTRILWEKETVDTNYSDSIMTKFQSADQVIKQGLNDELAQIARQLSKSQRDTVLILDDVMLQTSKAMIRAGFQQPFIHSPNFDSKVFENIHANRFSMSTLESAHDFLLRRPRDRHVLIWLDYYGTLQGNKRVNPAADIALGFKRLRRDQACFAVTFCRRGMSCLELQKQVMQLFQTEANRNGYRIQSSKAIHYGKNKTMMFAMVIVIGSIATGFLRLERTK